MTQPRCPYCLDDLLPDQEKVRCKECRTPHHQVCFEEHQGCVAFGCQGREQVPSNLSVFLKEQIQLGDPMACKEVELGPFILGYRVLNPIPETRTLERCPPAYARLNLESQEIREGSTRRGRAAVYVPREIHVRRIDLALHQSIGHPRKIARVPLVVPQRRRLLKKTMTLASGSHPFHIELTAPEITPVQDPYLLELILVRGVFDELRSSPFPLFLLQRPSDEPDSRYVAPPIIAAQPPPPPVVQEPPRVVVWSPPHLLGGGGDGWRAVPVYRAGSLYDSGEITNRTVEARFCPAPGAPKQLTLESPSRPLAHEFNVRIIGGGSMSCLNLAIHYELIRPGGKEVILPGFPSTEELPLLGGTGLEPGGYTDRTGVELIFKVPPERLDALERARQSVARNAALRLRLAVDAIDVNGRVVPCPTRSVTFIST